MKTMLKKKIQKKIQKIINPKNQLKKNNPIYKNQKEGKKEKLIPT